MKEIKQFYRKGKCNSIPQLVEGLGCRQDGRVKALVAFHPLSPINATYTPCSTKNCSSK